VLFHRLSTFFAFANGRLIRIFLAALFLVGLDIDGLFGQSDPKCIPPMKQWGQSALDGAFLCSSCIFHSVCMEWKVYGERLLTPI
jgi:hypothetical protein